MKNTILKSRFMKIAKWFMLLFLLLFIFRIIYGYIANDNSNQDNSSLFMNGIENIKKNYASEKKAVTVALDLSVPTNEKSNQKFEKTASLKSKSAEFESDEKQLKSNVKAFNAVIQYEQNMGQKGNRQIHIIIGINPMLFDSFYQTMKKIGVLKVCDVTKVDKTNEFLQLNAKKMSIQKNLQSMNDLKNKGGQISEFVSLNEKILEIEERLQELGVELGNFDAENEFCTVRFSLFEGATEKSISFMQRVKVAFEWSIKYFIYTVFALLGVSLAVFMLLLILDKLKIMKILESE